MKNTLALTPWELIRDAIKDLELSEANPAVVIDMDVWHKPSATDDVCYQCLAGSVISNSLNANIYSNKSPQDYSYILDEAGHNIGSKLNLLDDIRSYNSTNIIESINRVYNARYDMSTVDALDMIELPNTIDYNTRTTDFKKAFLNIADILEEQSQSMGTLIQ